MEEYTVTLTVEEYDYLVLVLTNLIDLEKRVPPKYKTTKAMILRALSSKLIKIEPSFKLKNKKKEC